MTDFEKLYNTYFNDVYLYIRRLSGDEHIAEEITSEAFFKAMHSIDSFRGDCDVRVWLCQIAKNCYYTHLKKTGKMQPAALDKDESGRSTVFSLDSFSERFDKKVCKYYFEGKYKAIPRFRSNIP